MVNKRIVFSYDPQIALQYLPYFVLKKCPDDFPKPPAEYGHYAYFLDFTTSIVKGKVGITEHSYNLAERPRIEDFRRFPIPDDFAQIDEDNRTQSELIYLINAITNNYIFQYSSNQGWFITLDGNQHSFYGQEGYVSPEYNPKPEILEGFENYELYELPILDFNNSKGESVRSIQLSDLFKIYFSSNKLELKRKYLNACIVLTKAYQLRKIDWSASYVFLVSAIESLIEIEHENVKPEICTYCKMPHFAVRQKFLNFIDKYGYKVDKKTKDLFSGIRNGIVHKGKLFGGNHSHKWSIETQEDLDAMYDDTINRVYYESFHNLVLTCFRTFLLFNLEKDSC